MPKPLILCIKWGALYDAAYVRVLRNAVARFLPEPHRFVCFTDNPSGLEDVETFPIPEPFRQNSALYRRAKGWPKLTVFQENLYRLQGRALFLDLDVVITGPLVAFFNPSGGFNIMPRPNRLWSRRNEKEPGNSSVFAFTLGGQTQIWDAFASNPQKAYDTFRNEQAFVCAHARGLQYWPDKLCLGFKHGLMRRLPLAPKPIPPQTRIISFYGSIKPHHMARPDMWRKRLRHGIRTLPWAKAYWENNGGFASGQK